MVVGGESPCVEVTEADSSLEPEQEVILALEEKERKAIKRQPGSFWRRPISRVYPDNFGFGVNGYQPMIDYLDLKDSGRPSCKADVHLPLLEERCMRQYESQRPFHWYDNRDIDQAIVKGENIRTAIRQNDACGVSNVLRRTHTNWSMTRKWVQLVKNSNVIDYRKLREEARKEAELGDDYIPPTPVKERSRHPSPLPYIPSLQVIREPSPSTYRIQNMAQEYAQVLDSLSHSKREHDELMAARRAKLLDLDSKFESVISQMTSQLQRLSKRSSLVSEAPARADRAIQERNHYTRQHEMDNVLEAVNDLTEMRSVRNQLRSNLSLLEDELRGTDAHVSEMRHRHRQEELELDNEVHRVKAEVQHRRSLSRARSTTSHESFDDVDLEMMRRRKQRVDLEPHEVVPKRRNPKLSDSSVMSDVHLHVLNRAGELTNCTSEMRRINNRAKFINIYRPHPNTGDEKSIIRPSKTELNIDAMATSLANKGKMTRRYDIDDENEEPVSNLNTNAKNAYCQVHRKPIEQHPSISRRVREATIRARARNSYLGN